MNSGAARGTRGALAGWAAAALLALLPACGGDEKTDHGLETQRIEGRAHGEPIEVRYDVPDGTVRVARIRIDMRFWQRRTGGARPDEARREGSAVLSLRQTFLRAAPDQALRSTVTLQYVEAEGTNAQAYRDRPPIVGRLEHDASGRPEPGSLRVDGGTLSEQVEALDLVGALLFAGLGGSPPWLPPRPVREGEAWRLETFVRPRALGNVVREAARLGVTAPTPVFSGTARLERVQASPTGPLLEVVLEALIEVDGPLRKDGLAGTLSIGHRFRGRARIEARTGLPVSFQVTHSGSQEIRSGTEHVRQEFTSEVQGTVTQGD